MDIINFHLRLFWAAHQNIFYNLLIGMSGLFDLCKMPSIKRAQFHHRDKYIFRQGNMISNMKGNKG